MSNKHKTLRDNVFRHSKYMKVVNEEYGCKDFKIYCNENKECEGHYDFMLETFIIMIDLYNCFYCDSNDGINKKLTNARNILGNYLYKDYNEETEETKSEDGKNRYSIRFLANIKERYSAMLHSKLKTWYENFESINEKSPILKSIIEEIRKEMERLEKVCFDNIVKEELDYEKNKDSDYKIYISKFDDLYNYSNDFIMEFIKNYNSKSVEPLTEEEISNICMTYNLVAKACNGITIISKNLPIKNYELNERSMPKDYYYAYLDSLNINKNDYSFRINSTMFMLNAIMTYKNTCAPRGLTLNQMMNNYDIYFFFEQMEDIVNKNDFVVNDRQIQKDIQDLRLVYEILMKSKNVDEVFQNIKFASEIIHEIIKRHEKYFIRVS